MCFSSIIVLKNNMGKRTIICLMLFSVFISVLAKDRTLQEIKQIAFETIQKRTAHRIKAVKNMQMDVIMHNEQLTVVGGDYGFAVIANDDAFPAVLGYSDRKYDEGKVAPGYLWWLEAISQKMEENLKTNTPLASVKPVANAYKSHVNALLETQWGQDTPYNNQTPTYTSGGSEVHYVTGCVATAMSQIMYYHQWPVKGKGTVSYYFTPEGSQTAQKLSANLAKNYDWANMLPVYKGVSYTDDQANAVSRLMMNCGYAVNMQYTKTGSGAYTSDAADALRKRFYYNENMHYYWRDYFPNEEWMECIFQELSDNHPVLYGAQSSSGGHSFVIDGYNENGEVHVNWGWEGNQDGFFNIASLNGYNSGQEMVLVRKNDETVPFQSYWGMEGDISISLLGSNLKAGFLAYNLDYNSFSGYIALLAMNLNTKAITVVKEIATESPVEILHGAQFEFPVDISSLADGTYRLYGGTFYTDKDTEWQPIRCNENNNNSYILTISNGKASIAKENNPNWTVTAIQPIMVTHTTSSSNAWYTIDGQRLNGEPTQRGIYIHNGHKVLK